MRHSFLLSAVASASLLCATCNIFEPSDREAVAARHGADAVVEEGKIQMQAGEFSSAMDLFDKALDMDSSKSEAYYYKSKCMLRLAGVDLSDVWSEINPKGDVETKDQVPFLYSCNGCNLLAPVHAVFNGYSIPTTLIDSVYLDRRRIYNVICKSLWYLEKIYYDAAKMDGHIVRKQYESDYLIEISVKTILSMIDINGNDSLDFVPLGDSTERVAYRVFCQDIPSLDSMDLDSLRKISKDPNQINDKLDAILVSLSRADSSYNNFHNELLDGAQKTDKLNPNMASGIGNMISSFKGEIPFYYYADTMDNDGNRFNTDSLADNNKDSIDRMIWIDWDGDDKIDINPPNPVNHLHIGDSALIAQDVSHSIYDTVDTQGSKYHRYIYKGGPTYEFIKGDFGVDEEIMDGEDNDQDGITDEDTRPTADTLDDDGDYFDANNNHKIDVTEWNDGNGNDTLDCFSHTSYNNEWTGGDWGVDEEIFDGMDNDGDGKIDEDVGKILPDINRYSAFVNKVRNQPHFHKRGAAQ